MLMYMTSTFSVTTPADILGYIPHALGFQPKESLVMLTLTGKRVGATLRVDLPAAGADHLDYASGICSFLQSDTGADGVLMVMYTDEPWIHPDEPPFEDLVHCLDLTLDAAGLVLRDGWLVTETLWRDYFCDDAGCCPWPGHPRQSITDSPLSAEMVYRGSSYARSLEAAVEGASPQPWVTASDAQRECAAYVDRFAGSWNALSLFTETVLMWDAAFDSAAHAGPHPGPQADPPVWAGLMGGSTETVGFLLASLNCKTIRDSVLVLAALGPATAVGGARGCGLLSGEAPAFPLPDECLALLGDRLPVNMDLLPAHQSSMDGFTGVLVGQYDGRLLWERMDCAHRLFSWLSAGAAGVPRAALLAMLGWIEWARGRGSRAHVYLQEALREVPDYTLALLLSELIGRGALATWSRKKEFAWQNESPHAA